MRKHLVRWWYTPRWQGDRLMQAIREWNQMQLENQESYDNLDEGFALREVFDAVDVAIHHLRHRLPYTGSGDLLNPYREEF